jgi:hypothetical protein
MAVIMLTNQNKQQKTEKKTEKNGSLGTLTDSFHVSVFGLPIAASQNLDAD